MKENWKLPSLALAATLLAASSAYALERAAPVQLAQAGPDDDNGSGGNGGGAPEPRGKGGDDGAAEPRGKRGDEGGGAERPQRPQREKSDAAEPRPERPARPARDTDAEPAPKKAPSPAAGDDDGPPQKKPRPPKDDGDGPPIEKKAAPPVEKKLPPPVEKKAAPEPKDEPAPALKSEPKPEPKAVPKAEPKEPAPKGAEPAEEPKAKMKAPDGKPGGDVDGKKEPVPGAKTDDGIPPAAKQPGAGKEPVPAEKGPDAGPPKKGVEGTLPAPDGKAAPAVDGKAPPADGKAPAPAAAPAGAAPAAAPSEVKDLKELKQERKERTEDGGKRVVIEEPDKRSIVKEGGKTIIRHDETERFRRLDRGGTRREKRNGLDISISVRPGGIEIYTETDDRGRSLRRYRRDRDGREVILFDNRDYYRRHNDGSFIDAIVDLPPPRMSISREDYILDYEEASDVEVYETLSAPPVEELDRTYSMEEVRRSPMLRDRMRRIDLDAINFEFGAWEVTQDQYPALQRVAGAMKRVIDRNPDEMFMIEGHTDAVGSDEDNLSLSDRRAESVAIILSEQFGVPAENLTTQGYGEQYLKVSTEQAERQNRRVAVRRITPLLSRSEK
ncbi:MAG: OmpA family protein [Hyphomicrobiaceae bacterium]|nr:OmpA family protein [Hyphomicrobiaceae bacterium]